MERRRFYQLSVLRLVDNPEARIAEDGRIAIELFVDFATGVTNALLMAASFVSVLWFIGGSLTFWGLTIPGYLVIAVVIYSACTSYRNAAFGPSRSSRASRRKRLQRRISALSSRTRAKTPKRSRSSAATTPSESGTVQDSIKSLYAGWP